MYKYKYGGKKGKEYQLVEAKDLVVVRTKGEGELKDTKLSKASRDLLPKLIQVGAFPEANVSVFKCVDKSLKAAKGVRDDVRSTFKKEKNIKFAGRVLKDKKSGTIFIYTENFFVKFNDELTIKRSREILKEFGLKVKDRLKFAKNSFFAQAKPGTGLEIFEIADKLVNHKDVEYAHPELIRQKKHKAVHPKQWHLKKTQIGGKTVDQHVDIEKAWKTTKGKGTIVAVIDDGVDIDHEEFKGKVVSPRDTLLKIDDPRPKYLNENHGTPCAGVAVASGKKKAAGVAPEAKLMPIRAGGLGSLSEANAFVWAADNHADVISCSWGPEDGPWWAPTDPAHFEYFGIPDSTRLALEYAIKYGRGGKGCVITWAAGNGNENVDNDGYAAYPKVIAVAACNDRGKRAIYSDFGDAIWCCFPSQDFYYPLLNNPRPLTDGIWTTDRTGGQGASPNDYRPDFGGTSSSCPGVAGLAALIISVNPALKWNQVKQIIKDSCDKIDEADGSYNSLGHSPFYGYGRVNAAKAVALAKQDLESEEEGLPFVLFGAFNFNKAGEIFIQNDKWTEAFSVENRLLGFELGLDPYGDDGVFLEYSAVINNKGKTPFDIESNYVGTKDRRRKLIGFAVKLTGENKDKFKISYAAKFDDTDEIGTASNGEYVGKKSGKGPAIEQIKITISRV